MAAYFSYTFLKGDPDTIFEAAKNQTDNDVKVVHGEINLAAQQHFYLEKHNSLVEPGSDGKSFQVRIHLSARILKCTTFCQAVRLLFMSSLPTNCCDLMLLYEGEVIIASSR